MADQPTSIRRSERFDVVLPARVAMADTCAARVKVSQSHTGAGGWIEAELTDFAKGGLGLMCRTFLPRNSIVRVRILDAISRPEAPPILEIDCRVHRVLMTDRRPAYLLGCGFENPSDDDLAAIANLIDRLGGEEEAG